MKGKEYTMNLTGLMSRIFQHEIDHLNGLLMWDDTVPDTVTNYQPEGVKITPRRIEKMQDLSEITVQEDMDKFYQDNKRYIFEY